MKITTYSIFASALVLIFALQGCTKTYIEEIVRTDAQKQNVEDDDVSTILKAVKGVSNVEIRMAATTGDKAPAKYVKQYFFTYAQPVDHNDASKGVFSQRVGMQLTDDLGNPVIVNTQGYAMRMDGKNAISEDIVTCLNANYVEIEFRYFGSSQPEDLSNVDFTYLYSEQSACDIHDVVTMLKANLFKNNKWVATGTSKGGTTSVLHAYYADIKDWKDFDVYVPFCAPFLAGTATSPLDSSVGEYVFKYCGYGYEAGSKEAEGYANLQKIIRQCESKKVLREAVLRWFHSESLDNYQTIMTQLKGATEEHLLAGFYVGFMETLITRFCYYPFPQWADLIPNPDLIKEDMKPNDSVIMDDLDRVVSFVFMDEDQFKSMIEATATEDQEEDTKAIHTTEDMLTIRIDPSFDLAYSVAAVRELGCVGVDFSWLPEGAFFTPELGYAVEDLAVGRARSMDYYEGQWDGGKLMTSLRNWVKSSTQKIVFVYGSNDPWTGGDIDDAAAKANPNVVKVVNPGGIHSDDFLHEYYYTKEASAQIQNAVKDFLNK